MWLLVLLSSLFLISTSASPIAIRPRSPSFIFSGDAPFTVDSDSLAAALTCPNGYPTSDSPPVLLVHGTSVTGEESWGQGYVPALLADGYTACFVTIPGRSMGDMQISTQYVAYSIHYISQLSGGLPTAIIAHSQGNPNTQWALQFWPSTIGLTTAFVSLAPDFHGIELFDSPLSGACIGNDLCQAALWQQSLNSKYYQALHNDNFNALVPTTTIWSQYDGIVLPAEDNAQLPGATVIRVQDLCPLRPVTHITITLDAAAYALALDALNHGGAADVTRVRFASPLTCLRVTASGMDVTIPTQLLAAWNALEKGFLFGPDRVSSEPLIATYALMQEVDASS